MSQSSSLPSQPFEEYESSQPSRPPQGTAAWKQEVNQKLAAHRTRRGGPQDAAIDRELESPRSASARAAEARARVAARYAKAPSYSELLAGEARAVVKAAGAAAEAARNAQAAAQAVLSGLETDAVSSENWERTRQETREQAKDQARRSSSVATPPNGQSWDEASWEQEWEAADRWQSMQIPTYVPPPRWYDEPPTASESVAVEAVKPPQKQQSPAPGAQPRWTEALPSTASALAAGRDVWTEMRVHPTSERTRQQAHGEEEGELFSPESFDSYETTVEPVQAIAANLIEFPRELIATRKARPRLAEGPLAAQENTQLSIFEVELDQLAPPIPLHGKVAPPEWASIELDDHRDEAVADAFLDSRTERCERRADPAQPAERVNYARTAVEGYKAMTAGTAGIAENLSGFARQFVSARAAGQEPARAVRAEVHAELQVASLSDRALAAVVDGACITLAFLAAAVVVTASTAHPPTGKIAMVAAACGLLLFGVLYQFLFLSYAEEGTPGMRYARIALCTFEDGNPTREQMRKRIPAMLLSVLTLGLGFVWALADQDHVSWHDRLTRTYQRKY